MLDVTDFAIPNERASKRETRDGPSLETTPQRSALMSRVRQHGTGIELAVRKVLHSLGARYRVNVRSLPGSPDIANRSRRMAVFVHGCFWHHHQGCQRGQIPRRNAEYWALKLDENVQRDRRKVRELQSIGFTVATVWECELQDPVSLEEKLREFWFQTPSAVGAAR